MVLLAVVLSAPHHASLHWCACIHGSRQSSDVRHGPGACCCWVECDRVACHDLAGWGLCHCCVMLQVPIVRAGGVEVIVAAARAHVGSVDVSHYACWALAKLAFDDANEVFIDVFPDCVPCTL